MNPRRRLLFDATIVREANELGPIMKAAGIKGG